MEVFYVDRHFKIQPQIMQLSVYKHINHTRLKLKNFGSKISLCVQLAVLSDKNANIGILIFVALTFYYARTLDEFGCSGIAIYIAIGTAQIVETDGKVATYWAVFVAQAMREEPVVSLAKIEDASRCTMIGTFEPIVQEARIVAIALQTLNHRLRLAYRYSSVGCAMNNPERQPPQSR